MNFCALSQVVQSVRDLMAYYRNNVVGSLNLLNTLRRAEVEVERLIFSLPAAVYGEPQSDAIHENHRSAPINTYGASKLMVEHLLADAAVA